MPVLKVEYRYSILFLAQRKLSTGTPSCVRFEHRSYNPVLFRSSVNFE